MNVQKRFYAWCDKHFYVYYLGTVLAVLTEVFFMNTQRFVGTELYLAFGMCLAYLFSSIGMMRIQISSLYIIWESSALVLVTSIDLWILKTIESINKYEKIGMITGIIALFLLIFFRDKEAQV